MKVSILIVTRNRAADLALTLRAMRNVAIPGDWKTELLVVDNGSTDDTRQAVLSTEIQTLKLRYIYESRIGQSFGRNRALEESTGDVLLFTDDDVRVASSWVVEMCKPIISGRADAVCGGVRIARHLLRPWMTRLHRSWLASTEWIQRGSPQSLVGANMAFSRMVLSRVARFDTELGPGASGFSDDTLFAAQLRTAGYHIHDGLDLSVVHHFRMDRMKRETWLNDARRRGESHAYIGYHWHHWGLKLGILRALDAGMRLRAWRAMHPDRILPDYCHEDELKLEFYNAFIKWRLNNNGIQRKYVCHGLEKI